MFQRLPIILAFSLGVCFSLIIFVAVQEYQQFTETKNISFTQNENNNEIKSLQEDLKKLTHLINSLSNRSAEYDLNFKMFKKRFDDIEEQLIESKELIVQLSGSRENKEQSLQREFRDVIDDLFTSINDTKESIDMLKEVYQNYTKTTELNQLGLLNSSSSSHTTNPTTFEVQSSTESVYPHLYDYDNIEECEFGIDLNTSGSEEIGASIGNDNRTNSEIIGDNTYNEGIYLGMDLDKPESDKTESIINNVDANIRSGPVRLYDDDSAEGSYLVGMDLDKPESDETETIINNADFDIGSGSVSLYDDDDAEGSYLVGMDLDKPESDKTETIINNADIDIRNAPVTLYDDNSTEGSYLVGMDLDKPESDKTENIINNADIDIRNGPVTLYDGDNAEGSYLVGMDLDKPESDKTETIINNEDADIRSGSVTLYDNDSTEGSYLVGMDLDKPESDKTETIINNADADIRSGPVTLYDNDSTEGSYLVGMDLDKPESDKTETIINNADADIRSGPVTLYDDDEENDKILPHFSSDNLDSILDTFYSQQTEVEFSLHFNKTVSGYESGSVCELKNMHLATIQSPEEQLFIMTLIKKAGQRFPHLLDADFWISPYTDWLGPNPIKPVDEATLNMHYANLDEELKDVAKCIFLEHEHAYRLSFADCLVPEKYVVCERRRD